MFRFCRILSMTCATLKRLFGATICFFLRFGLNVFIKFDMTIRFVVLLFFLASALLILCHHFLLHFWPWVDIFVCPDFAFFFRLSICFPVFSLLKCIASWSAHLVCPLFLPLALSEHHNHLWRHIAFFAHEHPLKKTPRFLICASFYLVFASLLECI